jgi:hypothetical protein
MRLKWICGLAAIGVAVTAILPRCAAQESTTGWKAISWEPTLKAAQSRARREGKPILLLHLFGRLDEEMC